MRLTMKEKQSVIAVMQEKYRKWSHSFVDVGLIDERPRARNLMRGECMRLSLWGYPDGIDKREGRSFSCGPSSVYHLPRRSGRSPASPYPPGRRRQVYQIAGRIHRKNSFGF